MTKYKELTEKYAGWISDIRVWENQADELTRRATDAYQEGDEAVVFDRESDAVDAYERAAKLNTEAVELYKKARKTRWMLNEMVADEYADCPFRATRNAGIDGFWREAGL